MKPASFAMEGIVSEVRELKTKEQRVWAHSVKVATLGATFELTTKDPALVMGLKPGSPYQFVGSFEHYNGAVKLILGQHAPSKAA